MLPRIIHERQKTWQKIQRRWVRIAESDMYASLVDNYRVVKHYTFISQ